jgi:hypothetical protein
MSGTLLTVGFLPYAFCFLPSAYCLLPSGRGLAAAHCVKALPFRPCSGLIC